MDAYYHRAGNAHVHDQAADRHGEHMSSIPLRRKLRDLADSDFAHRALFTLRHAPGDLRRLIVRSWQRGRRGWGAQDTWSFDYYLARVTGEGLLHLAEHTHGWPALNDEFPTFESWQEALRKHGRILITYALDEDDDDLSTDEQMKQEAQRLEDARESMRWVATHLGHLWD